MHQREEEAAEHCRGDRKASSFQTTTTCSAAAGKSRGRERRTSVVAAAAAGFLEIWVENLQLLAETQVQDLDAEAVVCFGQAVANQAGWDLARTVHPDGLIDQNSTRSSYSVPMEFSTQVLELLAAESGPELAWVRRSRHRSEP